MGAAFLVPLTALVGASLDLSVAYTTQAKLQNACDAAVLAGRQSMSGVRFRARDRREADNFFEFNFPEGTHGSQNANFTIVQNPDDRLELIGTATTTQPNALMTIFGYDTVDIAVNCNARRDQFDNDIVLVLDVTGSMNNTPSVGGSDTKIELLREGAKGLYRALEGEPATITRYGIVPYSHTVNPSNALRNRDIIRDQEYVDDDGSNLTVNIVDSQWNPTGSLNTGESLSAFRNANNGCIEERPSIGEDNDPAEYSDTITLADVDTVAANGSDRDLQHGRYDPPAHNYDNAGTYYGIAYYYIHDRWVQTGCPSPASQLARYNSETDYNTAIDEATANVTGGTYHDIGLLWGLRFVSRNGPFASSNPTVRNDRPVNQHIIFMTDGKLDTGSSLYSGYGIEGIQNRVSASNLDNFHITRFRSACRLAKSMGITVWVIAFDVTDTDDIEPCATSNENFYTSDGTDLVEVFESIGDNIGYLRLTT